MLEERGDLWSFYDAGEWVCITTNGAIKKNGFLVTGAGCAKEASDRFPDWPYRLGTLVKLHGIHVYPEDAYRLVSFPVKYHWRNDANLRLIERSCEELMELLERTSVIERIYLPRPGCGNGRLEWDEVQPVIAPLLDDRVIVVTW